jgi:histidinol-phosphatase (PHP family)
MLSNLHTHTTFCDGQSTAEQMVLKAIEKGFVSLGFSGHAYTPFELTSCMTDEQGYINEINRLKKVYEKDIEIYLGTEEDAFALVDRSRYEYVIGSLHFLKVNGQTLPLDIGKDYMYRCFEAFGKDVEAMAESYYSTFADYLLRRRPDVVGHFDLLTKYDEVDGPIFLGNNKHDEIAKAFLRSVARGGLLFEVNTGAIARGYRTSPYPSVSLLHLLKKEGANITLTSDCHNADYLDCHFSEAKNMLYDIGFRETVIIRNNKFTKIPIKL